MYQKNYGNPYLHMHSHYCYRMNKIALFSYSLLKSTRESDSCHVGVGGANPNYKG